MKKILSIVVLSASVAAMSFAASRKTENGFALQESTTLWVKNAEGEIVYSTDSEKGTSVAAGTPVKVFTDESVSATLVTDGGKTKTPNVKFNHVSYDGKEYYVLANRMTVGGTAAIILEPSATYLSTNPSDYDIYASALKQFKVVVEKKTVSAVSGIMFNKIEYFSETEYAVKTAYVKSSKVSAKSGDLKAVEIISKINAAEDNAVKEALIDAAFKLEVSSQVDTVLRQLDSVIHGSDLSEDVEDVSMYVKIFTGDGSKLNYRDLPGTKGSVVGQIANGEEVYVSQKTVFEETLDDATSSWLRISVDGKDVWIFGAYTYEISAPSLDESYDNEIESNESLDEDDADYGE